jgi:serine/threonine-protein kinase RsbW
VLMRLVLRLPRDPVTVSATRRTVDCALDAIGVVDECRDDVALALTEACANVVRHAASETEYQVTVTATASRCTIDVRDAPPDAPVAAEPPPTEKGTGRSHAMSESGRGLNIVRHVMDAVQVVVGPRGFAVHMVKQLIFGERGYVRRLST